MRNNGGLVPPIAVVRTTCNNPTRGHIASPPPQGEMRRSNSHDIELFEELGIFDLFCADFVEFGFSLV